MYYLTIILFIIGFSFTLSFALFSRLANGATISQLVESRFYEIIPIRALFWLFIGALGEVLLLNIYLLAIKAQALYLQEQLFTSAFASLLPFAILIMALVVCCRLLWNHLLVLPNRVAPKVDIQKAPQRMQIASYYLASLGSERFPNHIAPTAKTDNTIRWGIVFSSIIVAGLLGYAIYAGWITAESGGPIMARQQNEAGTTLTSQEVAIFLLWSSSVMLTMLLLDNQDYTFVSFRHSLASQVVLLGLAVASLFTVSANFIYAAIGAGGCFLLCGGRVARDLLVSSRYRAMKRVTDPIAADLKKQMPYLNQISQHPDFKLADLDTTALSERITRGCVNVEERGIFIVRSFARFMRIVEIEWQNFTTAMLRYLTVNRGVSLSGGTGTYESLRHPQVPVWNFQLFPLRPPIPRGDDGFRDMDDALPLNFEWDVVQTCGQCGGFGRIWVTETYYETEYYMETSYVNGQAQSRSASRQVAKTRQVQRTCPSCGGSGRTRHQQILNTWWRYLIPRITHPKIPIPELIENAEERRYFRLPLTEDFQSGRFPPETSGVRNVLMDNMITTGQQIVLLHNKHTQAVLSLKKGRLYKADFQVCGFRTIHILFKNLGGRGGWFFGKRPEFYFPRLPLCYVTIGTFLFLPPLALAFVILIQRLFFEIVSLK